MAVIRESDKVKHLVSSFVFNDLDTGKSIDESDGFEPMFAPQKEKESEPQNFNLASQNSGEKRAEIEKRDKMIESLLQKSDSLASELAKVQAKLTNQESLFRDEMTRIKDEAYNRGIQDGLSQAKMEKEQLYGESIHHLQDSITKLETLSSETSSMLQSIEKELVHTSVAIAKEVIGSEISYNSGQVAINLARTLLKKIEDAKEVKIRVNMLDYETVRVGMSDLKYVEVMPDSAVTKGGVIIVTEIGSIEGNIMERFKKIKDDALSKIGN
jgi:flagellar assembly protein FliH